MQERSINELIESFEKTLKKPHNYIRIVKQYLKACIEMEMTVSFKTRHVFLINKSPVYKTALNKFFHFIGEQTEIKLYEEVEEYNPLLEEHFYKDLSQSSKVTYDNIIKAYIRLYGNSLNVEDLKEYLKTIKNTDTHNINLSVLKKYFEHHGVWIRIKQRKVKRKKTTKGIFTEKEIFEMSLHIKKYYSLEKRCIISLLMFCGLRSIEIIRFYKQGNDFFTKVKDKSTENGRVIKIIVPEIIKSDIEIYFKDRTKFSITDTSTLRKYVASLIEVVIGRKHDDLGNPYSTHSFRHSFALIQRKKGKNLEELAQLMNHKSFDSTSYYAQLKAN